jgi:hypothetical protein
MFGSVAWSNLSALLLMAPSAIFGGWLYRARVLARERQSGRNNHDQ